MESLPLVPGIDWAGIKLALKALTSWLVIPDNPSHVRELGAWFAGAAAGAVILASTPTALPGLAIGALIVGFMWLGLKPFALTLLLYA